MEQDRIPLAALAEGDAFSGCYLLKSAQSAAASNGKPYLSLRLADLTGELPGKLWDYDGPIGAADAGGPVWASGHVESYRGALQARLDELRRTVENDDVDLSQLIPTAPRDAAQMLDFVEKTLRSLEDADYRAVCLAVLERHRDAFAAIPASLMMHHVFLHGLLMHTANMMLQAAALARIYSDVADRSLLLAGAFLHDIGKLAEFTLSDVGLVSDYSREGQLLGHIFLGAEEVGAVARSLEIPEEKALLLQHLLVSHHGKREFGAITLPRCAEAELLANIDMIDSRMEIYAETFENLSPGSFSARIFALDKKIYRPEES